jgi:hypothetical protein
VFRPWLKNFPVASSVKPMVKGPLLVAGGSESFKVLMSHAAAHGFEEVLEQVFEELLHSISFR